MALAFLFLNRQETVFFLFSYFRNKAHTSIARWWLLVVNRDKMPLFHIFPMSQ